MTDNRNGARKWFMLAGLFTGLFFVNVALRMLFIKLGIAIWRLGDVGEFLLVLAAMVFFVSGLLSIEEKRRNLRLDSLTTTLKEELHEHPQN
ncbi:MAG: hypothetical protein D4R74_06800 [Betaproteobacteria bacterium]|nr:MAG: hypothetical protein D4R74_06800 [Betaproteobacteria bacterium]